MVLLRTPCLMGKCSLETIRIWKEHYRYTKKSVIRAGFTAVTGIGIFTLAKEAVTDGVKRHAKRYIGGILVNGGFTCVLGGLPLLTNATKVVKYSKACDSVFAASWRVAHNIAELPIIAVDYAVFGEYVPSCGEADYDIYSSTTDIISEFTGD